MPFFLKPEAGSAVSDLLDERLRRLEQQLEDSQKSCEGLAGQVEAFTKATREMCGSAGNAAKGFGFALQVDSTIKIEPPKPTAAALISTSDEGSGEDDVQAAAAAAAAAATAAAAAAAAAAAKRRRSGSFGSREPVRAELLALQLNECASEMEEHLLVQVVQPLERLGANRNDVQVAIRGRTRAAENLCAAHSDYARAVSRCQTSVDGLHGGPPLDVVQAGDVVVRESDAFAQAHGLAEEALSSLLEERGKCLREAAASLKAAQAGFFVRASRCVSSSVGWESADEVLSRAMDDTKLQKIVPARVEDTKLTPTIMTPTVAAKVPSPCGSPMPPSSRVPLAAVVAAVRDADEGIEDSEGGSGTAVAARKISFNAGSTGINGRSIFTGKGRKTGDGDALDDHGRMQSEMKRRRSSGWFRRLTSSFQSNRERSASDELLERAESPLPEVVNYGGDNSDAEDGAGGGSRAAPPPGGGKIVRTAPILSTKAAAVATEVVSPSTAPTTAVSSATTSEERSLFAPDRVPVGDTPPSEEQSSEQSSERSSERSSEQSSGKSSERSSEQSSEKSSEQSSERSSEQSSERSGQSNGSDPGRVGGGTVGPIVVGSEAVAERVAGLGEEGGGGGGAGVARLVGGRDGGRAETDEEESDDETGSYTTEGFGSDDAGDLWEGGRASGLLDREGGDGGRGNWAVEGDDGPSDAGVGGGRTGVVAGALGDAAPINAVGGTAAGVPRESGEAGAAKAPLERYLAGIENGGSGFGGEGAASAALEDAPAGERENGGKRGEVGIDGGDGGGGGGGEVSDGGESGDKSKGGYRVSDSRKSDSGDSKVANGGSAAAERAQSARLVRPPVVVTPSSPRASTARSMGPPAPPPVLPPSLPDAALDSPVPTVSSERRTLFSPSKPNSSPAISEGSNKESPRAWRMSWWARASDRHPPPPPVSAAGGCDGDDDATVAGSSVATALAAAAAGGEEAAPARRPGGEFAPAFSGGDAPAPAVVERGDGSGKTLRGDGVEATAVAAAVAAERRTRNRLRRAARLGKPWLSAQTLVNAETRPLEAACRFLDVAGLGRATEVCRSWGKRLGGEAGAREWIRCVRLADGVPEGCRAGFYLHVLYDQPSWVPKARRSSSRGRPRPGVYEECLRKADDEEEVSIATSEKLEMISEDRREDGYSPLRSTDGPSHEPSAASRSGGAGCDSVEPSSAPRSYKWLKEIETDVLRTCPADAVGEFDRIIWRNSTSSVPDRASPSTSPIKSNGSSRSGGSGAPDGSGGSGDSAGGAINSSVRSSIALRSSLFGPDISRANGGGGGGGGGSGGRGGGGGGGGGASKSSARGERRKATQTRRADSVGTGPGEEAVNLAGAAVEAGAGAGEAAAGNGNISEAFWEGEGEEVVSRRFSVAGGGTREKLRRVLRAFAVYNRRVSYCQGMNFVALALLEASSGDDENAFWILVGMCDFLDLEGLWCQGLERLDLCFFSLDKLLRRHCPSLRQHLADEGVELSMFTSRWFVTLFTSTDVFGRGISRKILDMLMVEGWPLIFKLSLGVLLEMRPLLEPGDMESILKVTKFPRAHLFGLRRDGTGRGIAGATFEEASQGSLCESIRAGQMVEHALLLHISEETLEQHLLEYRLEKLADPGSD